MKDKIIFRLCDLRGLCGGKITLLLLSALQKLTTEHTEYTERVRVMNKFLAIGRMEEKCAQPHVQGKISLCDLRGLCGGKITFLQWSQY